MKIKEAIKNAAKNVYLIRVYFRFQPSSRISLIPLIVSDKLFLAINDFTIDGYSIYRFKDVIKIKNGVGLFETILKKVELTTNIIVPSVDISDWRAVFESLKSINKNIIVEKQTLNDKESEFVIGRIDGIYKNFAYVWHFDAEGIWEDSPIKIPYSEITNITFASRYVEIFSKYISEPPQAENR